MLKQIKQKNLIQYMFVSWAKAPATVYYFINKKVHYRNKNELKCEATVLFSSNPRTPPLSNAWGCFCFYSFGFHSLLSRNIDKDV